MSRADGCPPAPVPGRKGDGALRRFKVRASRIPIAALAVLMLLAAAPTALAAGSVTAKGRPHDARKLSEAVNLPNGQRSAVAFTLRKANGSLVTGYAVGSTRYFENFDFGGYHRVPRSAAFRAYRARYTVGGKLTYTKLNGNGKTYKILTRVSYLIVGE